MFTYTSTLRSFTERTSDSQCWCRQVVKIKVFRLGSQDQREYVLTTQARNGLLITDQEIVASVLERSLSHLTGCFQRLSALLPAHTLECDI